MIMSDCGFVKLNLNSGNHVHHFTLVPLLMQNDNHTNGPITFLGSLEDKAMLLSSFSIHLHVPFYCFSPVVKLPMKTEKGNKEK